MLFPPNSSKTIPFSRTNPPLPPLFFIPTRKHNASLFARDNRREGREGVGVIFSLVGFSLFGCVHVRSRNRKRGETKDFSVDSSPKYEIYVYCFFSIFFLQNCKNLDRLEGINMGGEESSNGYLEDPKRGLVSVLDSSSVVETWMDKKKGLSPLPFSGNLLVGENRYGKSSEASIEVYLNTKYNNGAERRRVMGIVLLKRRRFEKLARVSMRISFVDPLGCLNHPPPPQPRTKT